MAWLLLISFILLGQSPGLAQAKGDMRIAEMRVSIWPEYDDPRVLVIYQGRFHPDSPLPGPVGFRIPRGAEIHMAGSISPQGGHQHLPFKVFLAGNGAQVNYDLNVPDFYMEFYYNPFKGGERKAFSYNLPALYPVDRLEVYVQQPLRATEFKTVPKPLSVFSDEKGFKYSYYTFQGLAKGREVKIGVSYTKADPNPSVEKATWTTPEGSVEEKGRFNPYIIIVSVFVSVMIAITGYYLIGSRRERKFAMAAHGGKKGERRFCPHCGQSASPDDNFCPKCGTRLRK